MAWGSLWHVVIGHSTRAVPGGKRGACAGAIRLSRLDMASLSSHQQGGITTAHSCDHGKHFTVHLFDDVGELRTDKPIWRNPNPSQTELALRIHGDDFWTIEWEAYRNHFLRATDGISFFNTSKSDLSLAVAAGCLLARRFLQCLRDDELPAQWAVGVKIVTSYSLELGILDVETLRWEMLLGGDEDDEPDNVYSIVATKGAICIDARVGAVMIIV